MSCRAFALWTLAWKGRIRFLNCFTVLWVSASLNSPCKGRPRFLNCIFAVHLHPATRLARVICVFRTVFWMYCIVLFCLKRSHPLLNSLFYGQWLKFCIQSRIIMINYLLTSFRFYIQYIQYEYAGLAKGYTILPANCLFFPELSHRLYFLFLNFSHTFQPLNLPFCFWSKYLLFFTCGYNKFRFTLRGTHTIKPLSGIPIALFPVWKWDRGQILFNAKEIESASCDAENCWRGGNLLSLMKV